MTGLMIMVLALGMTYSMIEAPQSSTPIIEKDEMENVGSSISVLETGDAYPVVTEPIELPLSESVHTIPETYPQEKTKPAPQPWNWEQFVPYATGFYCIGVILMIVRLFLGLQGGQRLRKFSKPVEDTRILSALSRQARSIGLSITPAITCCKRIMVPTVVGVLRPTILIPFSFTSGLNFEQVEMLLAHELAHIRRYDPLLNVIQRIIEAILFFHPAVWFLSRRIRIERENCCDDLVLKVGGTATAYASSLVEVAQKTLFAASQRTLSVEGVAAVNTSSQLRSRIMRILGSNSNPPIRLRRPWILLTVLILISIFAITSSTPKGISKESRPSENQVSPSQTERGEEDANSLRDTVLEGFRANRGKLTSCILSWTKRTKEDGFVHKDRKLDYGGKYELWWDGKNIATKYTEDQVVVYGEDGLVRVEKYEGGISYDGDDSSRKPEFSSHTNWFEIIQWSGKLPLDKRIAFFANKKDVISKWSVTETEGTQKIKHLVKRINDDDYGIEYYDPTKGYNLIIAESYNSQNELYSKRTMKLKQVAGGVWFPIEVEERAINPKLKKDELRHHFVLNLERCSFNNPKAIPEGVFESPAKEKQKELDSILEKFKPDTPSKTEAKEVQRAGEAAENFIAAVLAGDKEKAVSFTVPRTRGDVDDSCEALQGQNVVIEAVFADREDALAISSVILGDHERVGPLSFKIEKVNDDWLINDIDLETTEDAEREIEKFLTRHPQASHHIFNKQRTHYPPPEITSSLNSQGPSQAWYMLRQWNVGPLLRDMKLRLDTMIQAEERDERVWKGINNDGKLSLQLETEGDFEGKIYVGFFTDPKWSKDPVQVRSFPGPGHYEVEGIPSGEYQIGAMIGAMPEVDALGVQTQWPHPVVMQTNTITNAHILVSKDFTKSGGHSPRTQTYHNSMNKSNLLQGQVQAPSGDPIPYAEISIREYNPGARRIAAPNLTTDASGNYYYDEMKWPYYVGASWHEPLPLRFGYRKRFIYYNCIFEGTQTTNLQFKPFPTGSAVLTGRATDQHGNPIRKFFLRVSQGYNQLDKLTNPDRKYYQAIEYNIPFISEDGTYRVEGLPPGETSVWVIPFQPQAYVTFSGKQETMLENGKTTEVHLTLTAKQVMYGRVLFHDDTPAVIQSAGGKSYSAKITMWYNNRRRGPGFGVAEVDPDGYFTLHLGQQEIIDLKNGVCRLDISLPVLENPGRSRTVGTFPFDLLATERDKAGIVKVKRPGKDTNTDN